MASGGGGKVDPALPHQAHVRSGQRDGAVETSSAAGPHDLVDAGDLEFQLHNVGSPAVRGPLYAQACLREVDDFYMALLVVRHLEAKSVDGHAGMRTPARVIVSPVQHTLNSARCVRHGSRKWLPWGTHGTEPSDWWYGEAMSSDAFVHQFELGPWDNFIYFVGDKDAGEVAVVDPAWDAQTILDEAQRAGVKITHILCSHSHFDHVDQVGALLKHVDVPVHMLKQEIEFSGFKCENLVASSPGDRISVGKTCDVTMVHTPGHTPGSVSYQAGDSLVTGDTLFVDGCGRCDFVGGDPEVMFQTLHSLADKLDPATRIYPGHNYGAKGSSTVGEQRTSNPYLLHAKLEDFVQHRMDGKTPNSQLPPKPTDWVPPRLRSS